MRETEYIITRVGESDTHDNIYHHGILGMKWGRRRYQNKDGSLTKAGQKRYNKETADLKAERKSLKAKARTQKKMDKLKDLISEVDDLKKAEEEAKAGESREEKRKRLLESTDAKEIYDSRNLLTTAELNDRINRIDTEARLASKIPEQETGLDFLNKKMNLASNTLNNVTNMFQKVDNAYSTASKSAIVKAVTKKLGMEPSRKTVDYDDFIKNISTKTTQEINDMAKRSSSEKILKSNVKDFKSSDSVSSGSSNSSTSSQQSSSSSSQGSYNTESQKKETHDNSYEYRDNSKTESESAKAFTGTVEGNGTSRYTDYGSSYVDNNPSWKDVVNNSKNYSTAVSIGQNYIAGYLPYNDKRK